MNLRSIVVWFLFLWLAVMNGALRNTVLTPRLGELGGHVASSVILCVALLVVTWLTIGWMQPANSRDAALIGVQWVLMTVAFEFLAGHYVFGSAWDHAVGRLQSLCRPGLDFCFGDDGVCSATHGSGTRRLQVAPLKPPQRVEHELPRQRGGFSVTG